MSAQQVVFQYLSAGSNTLTVPPGFSNQVLVYAWGAGGGAGYNAPAGGGGGFVQGIVTVSSGDTVVISVGSKGGVGPRDGSGIGGIGDTPTISFNGGTTGVAAPYPGPDDQFYGAGGGGGAATSVLVNGIPMIVAAGGGGGGGGTSYQTGSPGLAGGVTTLASTTPRGGTSPGGYSVGGGGGAGYPFGGAGGETFGDDAGAATGGYGGQNYANASVTSSTLTAGSGITPGGLTNALYPRAKRGYAGYDGAVIVIFTKNFRAWIKDTTWKEANNAWVKVGGGSTTATRTVTVPAGSTYSTSTKTRTFTTPGITSWDVPTGVTSIEYTIVAGGGGGGTVGYSSSGIPTIVSGGGGGGSGGIETGSFTSSPGTSLTITVGNGGGGVSSERFVVNGALGEIGEPSSILNGYTRTLYQTLGGGGGQGGSATQGGNGGAGGNYGGGGGTAGTYSALGIGVTGGGGGINSTGYGSGGGGGGSSIEILDTANLKDDNTGRVDPALTSVYNFFTRNSEAFSSISAPTISGAGTQTSGVSYNAIATVRATLKSGYRLAVADPYLGVPGHEITHLEGPDTIVVTALLGNSPRSYTPAPAPGYYPPTIRVDSWGRSFSITSGDTPSLGWAVGDNYDVSIIKGNPSGGEAGNPGFVRLTYTQTTTTTEPTTTTETYVVSTTAGGWKQITQAWVKEDNEWKSIQSGISLVPIPSTAEVVTINLNIAANTNNYVLSDFLSGTSYYPGRSIVNLTVDAGVIVGSGSAGTPALIVDGLVSGDLINLINNGNIAGAGGLGGAAGSYSSVTSGGSASSKAQPAPKGGYTVGTTTVTSVPGRAGEIGGPALYVTYLTNLVNNGTIAGGGGGGGGGGGPTGGQGGGGAGRKAGSGANNGTLTAGGAGAGLGGAGGARGSAGSAGTNDTNAGGLGGAPGAAIIGINNVAITTAGTIIGERKVIAREVG